MFSTGIENSSPTIVDRDDKKIRVDEMEKCGHYKYWRRDLELVRELGLRYLRYGPPLHRVFLGPDKYDWSFMDQVCEAMQELGIVPIMDLCHFGLPDWLENFQNPINLGIALIWSGNGIVLTLAVLLWGRLARE